VAWAVGSAADVSALRQDHPVRDYVAVTGAASGLGRIIAGLLLGRGRAVAIVDSDDAQAHAVADELGDEHQIEVPVVVADLSDIAQARTAADQLIERVEVAALVNNAGGWLPGAQFPDADPDQWLSAMTLNLLAPMLLTQRLWPMLCAASAGAVVNIGSSGGLGDAPYGSPEYGAAKAGIRRFTASLGSRPEVRVMVWSRGGSGSTAPTVNGQRSRLTSSGMSVH
jgi:short-subunit dehydrogenase